jgi:hypothetical protein
VHLKEGAMFAEASETVAIFLCVVNAVIALRVLTLAHRPITRKRRRSA